MAGGLKRELISRGIEPKIKHAYGDLEVIVDGHSVFSYKREGRKPTVNQLLIATGVES